MANRYSKSNNSAKAKEEKTMEEYRERQNRMSFTAKVVVIVVALAMIVTTFLGAGVFLLD